MKNILLFTVSLFTISMIMSCERSDHSAKIRPVIERYVAVWNGDSLNRLDKITAKNFQLRMVPLFEPVMGIENLKREIARTRDYFPDFFLKETEMLPIGDSAVVVRWIAMGTFRNKDKMSDSIGKIKIPGYSVIFFDNGQITGEWISYSDLTWFKQLGFKLIPPDKNIK